MTPLLGGDPISRICSRAGCTEEAAWNVNWRNPRIHGADRVKVWVACEVHRDYLEQYLTARDFPVVVTVLGDSVARVGAP